MDCQFREDMKRVYRYLIVCVLAAAAFSACVEKAETNPRQNQNQQQQGQQQQGQGQQASQKPSDEIQQADQFAKDMFSVYYLWNKEINSDLNRLSPDTCKSPITVVEEIRYHKSGKEVDHWTQLTNNLGSMTSSVQGLGLTYGYELQAGRITNKNGVYFLIVCYVVKDSPAEKGGLKRGDLIMTIDGSEITASNIYDAFNTKSVQLGIAHLTADGYLGPVEKQVDLTAVDMWENPVVVNKTFDIDGKKVGYLVYNSFDVNSLETLPVIFRQFREEGIKELILDLRYNGGGYVITECALASMIAPPAAVAAGEVFQTEVYNSLLTEAWKDEDFNTYFSTTHTFKDSDQGIDINVNVADANPGVSKLYVIVTGGSASASEGLIVGLGPYMDITLVGQQTYGKYCAGWMLSPEHVYGTTSTFDYSKITKWGMYVMVSKFADKNRQNSAEPDGIPVDIKAEDDVFDGYQLGDENETMLKAALKAAGKTYAETKAAEPGKPYRTEFIERDIPRGILIKNGLPAPFDLSSVR